jgi:hypothetical protein
MVMTLNSADPKLEALDEVEAALREIYAAKRDGTATEQDDVRLKKLHLEWMSVMWKIGVGGEVPPRPAPARPAQNEGDDSDRESFVARLRSAFHEPR